MGQSHLNKTGRGNKKNHFVVGVEGGVFMTSASWRPPACGSSTELCLPSCPPQRAASAPPPLSAPAPAHILPTLLPRCLSTCPPGHQTGCLLLPNLPGRGLGSVCRRGTPILQMESWGPQSGRGEIGVRIRPGEAGWWQGMKTVAHCVPPAGEHVWG